MAISSILSVWSVSVMASNQPLIVSSYMFVDSFSLLLIWSLSWVSLSVMIVPSSGSSPYVLASLFVSFMFYTSSDWVMFFIWFEVSMLPMFMLITSHSTAPERLHSSRLLFMYTVLASFPLLLFVLDAGSSSSSFNVWLSMSSFCKLSGLLSLLAWMSFMVKLPLFTVHLWLLKAHVEAPMLGSMFLAGTLLKFGGMGVIRLLTLNAQVSTMNAFILGVSLWGASIAAAMALFSSDVKVVVAYASVSHMNLGLVCGLLNSYQGLSSFMLSMVAHSFSSSLLFYSVTRSYEKAGSRSIVLLKGALSSSSLGYFLGVVTWSMNMNIPPFLGLSGELVGFLVIVKLLPFLLTSVLVYFIMSSGYSMVMFINQFHLEGATSKPFQMNLEYFLQHVTCTVPMVTSLLMVSVLEI